jgi:hypothetical protein
VYGGTPPVAAGEPPTMVLLPIQTVDGAPALTTIAGDVVAIIVSRMIHPLASVTATIYDVVARGAAVGFATVVELKPDAGDHA